MNELLSIRQSERPLTRRLAAIAFLDVVGYSRLMAMSEETTLAAWSTLQNQVIEPRVRTWRGRIIDRAGDGIFAEFGSALDALQWAVDVQDVTNRWCHVGEPIRLRIALHLADVIDGLDGAVHGDGVNAVARLQTYADSGGVIVSRPVVDAVSGKTSAVFADLGPLHLKNIARPLHAFRLHVASDPAPKRLTWRRAASIALPAVGVIALLLMVLTLSWRTTPRDKAERLLRQGLAISCTESPCPRERLAARALFEQAIAVDPTYARPYAEAATTYTYFVANNLSADKKEDIQAAARLATQAVALAPDQAFAYKARGGVLRQNPDMLEQALTAYLHSLAIKPNQPTVSANVGWVLVLLGRPAEAEPYLKSALAAAPNHIFAPFWLNRLGLVELFLDRKGHGADFFRRAITQQSQREAEGDIGLERAIDFAAALALEGEINTAQQVIDGVRGQHPLLSTKNIWNCGCSYTSGFQAGIARLRQGAALAGVPDLG